MRDGGGQKGQAVVPSSSSSGSLNQKEGWGLEGVFGRGKYKLWALAAITLLALWTMFTGTTVTRKWSDVNLKHSDPSSLHSDLDILISGRGLPLDGTDIWTWSPAPKDSVLFKELHKIRSDLTSLFGSEAKQQLSKWFAQDKGTSSAYEGFRNKWPHKLWHTFTWQSFIPPKWSFNLWLAIQGRLATRDRLDFLNIPQVCPICSSDLESNRHLFFECQITRQVWDPIKCWLNIRMGNSTILSTIKWCKRNRQGSSINAKAKHLALTASTYTIWKERNRLVFEQKPFQVREIISRIKDVDEREKMVRQMWNVYKHSSVVKLPSFWREAFGAAYEDLSSEVAAVRDAALYEIAKMSFRSGDISDPPPRESEEGRVRMKMGKTRKQK